MTWEADESAQDAATKRRDYSVEVATRLVHVEPGSDNLFQMRVFPIPGRDVKRILLDYTIPLTVDGPHYRFRLPLASDVEPILDFRLTGAVQLFASKITAEDVTSPSHPELVRDGQADGSVAFSLARRQYRPPPEFVVGFPAAREQPPTAVRSYRARGRPGDAVEDDSYSFLAQINRRGNMPPVAPADVLNPLVEAGVENAPEKAGRSHLGQRSNRIHLRSDSSGPRRLS